MLAIEVTGAEEVAAGLAAMPDAVRQALERELTALSAALLARVRQKLSGEVLAARSGLLRDSVYQEIDASGDDIRARIAVPASVPYAAIHEFGGSVPPHTIAARNAQALRFVAGGKALFARRVQYPGGKMPERSYLRAALAEMQDEIAAGVRAAVADATAALRD